MLALLLPLLGVAVPVVASGTRDDVQQVLSDTVHARVQDGWVVVDTRDERDSHVITAMKGDRVERHVFTFADVHTYQIEPDAQLPADLQEPSESLVRALAAPRGGFRLMMACGETYEVPYEVEDAATDGFAAALVTRTLATASDLVDATVTGRRAKLIVERGGHQFELYATLDARGTITAAELRRTYHGADKSTQYKQLRTLKAALAGGRVIAIDAKGVTLQLAKTAFALDPEGTAFSYDGDYEGCGC
jgi:hypothetical protein